MMRKKNPDQGLPRPRKYLVRLGHFQLKSKFQKNCIPARGADPKSGSEILIDLFQVLTASSECLSHATNRTSNNSSRASRGPRTTFFGLPKNQVIPPDTVSFNSVP